MFTPFKSLGITSLSLTIAALSATHANAVECTLVTEDIWSNGFTLEYQVTNNSSQTINNWQVVVDLPASASLNTNWNSQLTSETPLTLNNASWNGNLAPAASATFGISGMKTGDLPVPDCVDPSALALEVPAIDTSPIESTSGNFGFVWQPIEGAVKYQVELTELDENGDPTQWELLFESTNASAGFGNRAIGHYGIRVNQCNSDGACSEFSEMKTAIVYRLLKQNVNTVTGTYAIEVQAPFPVTLLENGTPIEQGVTGATFDFRHQTSGTFEYQLEGLEEIVSIEVNRFDPNIAIDRSVFVHDEATLDATQLSMAEVFFRLADQMNQTNNNDLISGFDLFARTWDAQNPADETTATPVEHCTGELNGFPVDCRPEEGAQAFTPEQSINEYRLISLVNRLDLRDRRDFLDCGEARMIFALQDAQPLRNLVIFEAQLPNPQPGSEAGCLPIAQFWHSLSAESDPAVRALALRNFYSNGLPEANVAPVIHIDHFAEDSGQVRTNQFMRFGTWVLKEYKVGAQNDLKTLFLTTVKNNPVGELFDVNTVIPDASIFQTDFANGIQNLMGGLSFIGLPNFDNRFNNGQSHSSGPIAENNFTQHFANSADSDFEDLIQLRLAQMRSPLSTAQVINRATAMTCGGCHQPGVFGLTAPDAVGPGQSWPDSLGFVHVQETPSNGVFELSPALNNVFLPDRRDDFETYLSTEVELEPEAFINTPNIDVNEGAEAGDRSG